jgi:hypothetical protein
MEPTTNIEKEKILRVRPFDVNRKEGKIYVKIRCSYCLMNHQHIIEEYNTHVVAKCDYIGGYIILPPVNMYPSPLYDA